MDHDGPLSAEVRDAMKDLLADSGTGTTLRPTRGKVTQ